MCVYDGDNTDCGKMAEEESWSENNLWEIIQTPWFMFVFVSGCVFTHL